MDSISHASDALHSSVQVASVPLPPLLPPVSPLTSQGCYTSLVSSSFEPIRLHFAVNSESKNDVQKCIDRGLDVNYGIHGNTPLTLSIVKEHFDIALMLIDAGADVCVPEKSKWQRQPLHLAAWLGALDVCKAVMRSSAIAVHATDAMLFTPLHWAALYGHTSVVALLISAGAHINVRDDRGCTPLHRAATNGHVAVAKMLIDAAADVNARDHFGWTPLYQSIVCMQLDMVHVLIDSGAHVCVADNVADSPLHVACSRTREKNLDVLCRTSTDFLTRHLKAATPAFYHAMSCADHSAVPLVELLLDSGADVNAHNVDGHSALWFTCEFGAETEVIRLLCNAGASLSSEAWISAGMWPAAVAGNVEQCDWLQSRATHVRSLTELCKFVIRHNLHHDISSKIVCLPLPSRLLAFLQLTS